MNEHGLEQVSFLIILPVLLNLKIVQSNCHKVAKRERKKKKQTLGTRLAFLSNYVTLSNIPDCTLCFTMYFVFSTEPKAPLTPYRGTPSTRPFT